MDKATLEAMTEEQRQALRDLLDNFIFGVEDTVPAGLLDVFPGYEDLCEMYDTLCDMG